MEDERKSKPVVMFGGVYAKAKQRVLNRLGRRTTLTRNPRVDFISGRVEDIKHRKAKVSALATKYKTELRQVERTAKDLNMMMLDAFKSELGEREWDSEGSTYVRKMNPEEKRMIEDMERVLTKCTTTMDRVLSTYYAHLEEVAQKPLTFHTPEEDSRLETVMATKGEYKRVRTAYSDAMIDADSELATGGDPSPSRKAKLEEAKAMYEEMSERLCEDALRYEHIYREELAQRVSAHFTAEQHLLRGVAVAMKEFYPYTRGLTLDWEELRTTRKSNLSSARRDSEEGENYSISSSLPPSTSPTRTRSVPSRSSGNPFSRDTDTNSRSHGEQKSLTSQVADGVTGITNKLASYAPSVRKPSIPSWKSKVARRGLDRIDL